MDAHRSSALQACSHLVRATPRVRSSHFVVLRVYERTEHIWRSPNGTALWRREVIYARDRVTGDIRRLALWSRVTPHDTPPERDPPPSMAALQPSTKRHFDLSASRAA
jgi:hypothetical protein